MDNDKIIEQFYNRFNKYNTKVLKLFASTIGKFANLTPIEAQRLATELKNGRDINNIIKELVQISGATEKNVRNALVNVAKYNIELAQPFYEYRNIVNSYEDSVEFQQIVNSIAEITNKTFENISRTTAIKLLDVNDKPMYLDIKKAYSEVIDRAVLAVTTGEEDFNSAMRSTVKQITDSGVKKVYYENGQPYAKRLDSTVRQNMLSAIKMVNTEAQKEIGKEIDANGVEISVHLRPAPDHEEVQGKRFTKEEYEKFQTDQDAVDVNGKLFSKDFEGHDRRSIEQYNCRHVPTWIILEIQKPLYTEKELQKIIDDNHKGFDFEGKHYTGYEGEQLQRQIELKIRQEKDNQISSKELGDMEEVDKAQKKISLLNQKYKELSEVSGLPTRAQRLYVDGYKKIKINN